MLLFVLHLLPHLFLHHHAPPPPPAPPLRLACADPWLNTAQAMVVTLAPNLDQLAGTLETALSEVDRRISGLQQTIERLDTHAAKTDRDIKVVATAVGFKGAPIDEDEEPPGR